MFSLLVPPTVPIMFSWPSLRPRPPRPATGRKKLTLDQRLRIARAERRARGINEVRWQFKQAKKYGLKWRG
jgi:hypothetical protein